MNLVKIKDNTSTEKDKFNNIPKLTKSIVNKTLKQLEHEGVFVFPELVDDANDISQDQMILQSVNDNLCSGNVMGFIGYGNEERLIINSRFSRDNEDYFVQLAVLGWLPLTVCSPAVHYPAAVCSESTGRSWAAVKNGLAGRPSRRRNVLPNG